MRGRSESKAESQRADMRDNLSRSRRFDAADDASVAPARGARCALAFALPRARAARPARRRRAAGHLPDHAAAAGGGAARRGARPQRRLLEPGPFRPVELVELIALDPTIRLDIRYATRDNFLATPVYTEARAFLQRPAAEALVRAHRALREQGFGLLIHDAYRPWWVTKVFWDATPADKHDFVADPAQGSRHNRGCAVDLTLFRLADGRAVAMPSLYDEMTERSSPT